MNILGVQLVGEVGDTSPTPTRFNTVIKTKHNGFKVLDDAKWDDWEIAFILPSEEHARYFAINFHPRSMNYFQLGMLPGDYVFHIVHFKYPKPDTLYADQLHRGVDADFED